ncbi:MAG: AAA family ATPase [Nanoarchaeota archaeon]|nr:AAA family ATPase [Nanoarchaeota archaeon]MCG2719001.1 AAA family ATPase [Nanoarchaeota archaeon]
MVSKHKKDPSSIKTGINKNINSLVTESTIDSYMPRVRNYLGVRQQYKLDRPITFKLTDLKNATVEKTNLYDLVKISSDMVERPTTPQINCLESVETCLATFLNYSDVLKTGFDNQEFINTYSLFKGAILARNHLRINYPSKYKDNPGKSELDLNKKSKDIVYELAQVLFKGIENAHRNYGGLDDEKVAHIFDTFYTQLINQCIALEPKYADTIRKSGISESHELKNISFKGFKATDKRQKELSLPNMNLEMIVGNEEFIQKGKRLAKNVLSYSFDAPNGGENPRMPFTQLMMVYGGPGTGKTVTTYALLNFFAETAKKNKLPFMTKVIRKSDWTSSYQFASARNLLNLFENEVFGFDGLVGVYWPDFDTAFQARNSPTIRSEEKDNLNVLFGLLDGTIGPRDGKWFIILDANYMDPKSMDIATMSRVMEEAIEVKGPEKAEHYETLLRDILLKDKKDFLKINDNSWKKFGELCKKYQLSGRAMEKIALQTSSHISTFEEPDGFFRMPYDEKMKIIKDNSNPIKIAWLMNQVDEYYKFNKQREDKDAAKKSEQEMNDLINQLSDKS